MATVEIDQRSCQNVLDILRRAARVSGRAKSSMPSVAKRPGLLAKGRIGISNAMAPDSGRSGQSGDSAPPWRDIPVNLGHAPSATIGGDDEIANQSQLKAAPGADPVDGGNGDRCQVLDHLRGFLILARLPIGVVLGPGQEVLNVISGAEGITGPAKNEEPAVAIALYRPYRLGQLVRHLAVQGVVRLRTIESDRRDRMVAAEQNLLVVAHLILRRKAMPS